MYIFLAFFPSIFPYKLMLSYVSACSLSGWIPIGPPWVFTHENLNSPGRQQAQPLCHPWATHTLCVTHTHTPPVWGCGYGWVGWGSFSQTQHEGVYRITASVHCSGTKHINQHGGVGSISKFTKEKKVLRKNCETTRSRQSSIQNQSKSGDCVSPMAWLEGKAIFDQRCRIGSHAFRRVSLFQTFFHTTRSPLSVNVTVIRPQSSLQISTIVFPVTQYKFRHNLALAAPW